MTRGERLPPLTAGAHLIEILFEIGPVRYLGMGGAVSIDEQDVHAWQCNQGVALNPWENRVIRRLSRDYAYMLGQASDVNCPPPYTPPDLITPERRQKIADAMSSWADKLNQQRKR